MFCHCGCCERGQTLLPGDVGGVVITAVTAPAHGRAGLNVFQALLPHQLEMMALYQNKMTAHRATCSQQIIFERFRKGNWGKRGLNLPCESLYLYWRYTVFLGNIKIGKCLEILPLQRAALSVWAEVVCHWCLPPQRGPWGCGPKHGCRVCSKCAMCAPNVLCVL